MLTIITTTLVLICSILLMFVILLQRGRGGGLAGAFGGLGGQSAFGTKAGDVFTRITIVLAIVWVVLNAASIYAMRSEAEGRFTEAAGAGKQEIQSIEDATADEAGKSALGDLPIEKATSESKMDEAGKSDAKSESTPPAADAKPAPEKTEPEKSEPAKTEPEKPAAESEKKTDAPAGDAGKAPAEAPKEPGK
jgi:preprotein translocase subunit SecG